MQRRAWLERFDSAQRRAAAPDAWPVPFCPATPMPAPKRDAPWPAHSQTKTPKPIGSVTAEIRGVRRTMKVWSSFLRCASIVLEFAPYRYSKRYNDLASERLRQSICAPSFISCLRARLLLLLGSLVFSAPAYAQSPVGDLSRPDSARLLATWFRVITTCSPRTLTHRFARGNFLPLVGHARRAIRPRNRATRSLGLSA